MGLKVVVVVCAAAAADYVRPPPGALLSFPRSKKGSSEPHQVHISLAGDQHMRISWVTTSKTAPSTVDYGTSSQNYTFTSHGDSTTYSYMLYSSGKIHHAVIGPLQPNTLYYYRCGGEAPEFQLKTPPSQLPVTFAVAGDLGQTDWTNSTLAHIDKCQYDVHLLPGDLSYADYLQRRWDTFGELVQPLASARPWMVTQGNHEREYVPFLEDGFKSYNSRWKMPYEESASTSNLFYSFEVAGVHVIMLGSYTDYDEFSHQFSWLKMLGPGPRPRPVKKRSAQVYEPSVKAQHVKTKRSPEFVQVRGSIPRPEVPRHREAKRVDIEALKARKP